MERHLWADNGTVVEVRFYVYLSLMSKTLERLCNCSKLAVVHVSLISLRFALHLLPPFVLSSYTPIMFFVIVLTELQAGGVGEHN